MNKTILTARLVAMSLVVLASLACRQSARALAAADSPEDAAAPTPAPRPAGQNDLAAQATTTERSAPTPTPKQLNVPREQQNITPPAALRPVRARSSAFGATTESPMTSYALGKFDIAAASGGRADLPSLLTTEAIDAKVEEEWHEDLAVMDKLLRDAVGGGQVFSNFDAAMGVKLKVLGGGGRGAPGMYVEGAGVIVGTSVHWPLARAARAEPADPNRPRDPDSPWDRAKRQLKGADPRAHYDEMEMGGTGPQPPAFDQKKLDDLIDDILYVLPQASNFRHLKDDESVFVTVAGTDDAGKPVRLTMKVKKSHINEAAAKKIDAETFKHFVSKRIG
jgi:hypothetical protein